MVEVSTSRLGSPWGWIPHWLTGTEADLDSLSLCLETIKLSWLDIWKSLALELLKFTWKYLSIVSSLETKCLTLEKIEDGWSLYLESWWQYYQWANAVSSLETGLTCRTCSESLSKISCWSCQMLEKSVLVTEISSCCRVYWYPDKLTGIQDCLKVSALRQVLNETSGWILAEKTYLETGGLF